MQSYPVELYGAPNRPNAANETSDNRKDKFAPYSMAKVSKMAPDCSMMNKEPKSNPEDLVKV